MRRTWYRCRAVSSTGTDDLAVAHDVVRLLNDREDSSLYGEIKLLGLGKGRVAQAPLAQELKQLFIGETFGSDRKARQFRDEAPRFFLNYFKQVAQVFGAAWNGRKYSIKKATALRGFIRVAPDVVQRLDQEHADRTDFRAIGRVIAPWGRRIGDLRFETDGAWTRSGTTVELLARELETGVAVPRRRLDVAGGGLGPLRRRCNRRYKAGGRVPGWGRFLPANRSVRRLLWLWATGGLKNGAEPKVLGSLASG